MVHTDGTPTIANAPARSRIVSGDAEGNLTIAVEDDTALLEREHSGVRVTLHYFAGLPVLRVTDAEGEHSVIVPKDEALEAFRHPYLYIAR